MKRILNGLIISLLFLTNSIYGQVTISPLFQTEEVFHLDYLFKFNIVNLTPQPITGHVLISIENGGREPIAQIASYPFEIAGGSMVRESQISWAGGLKLGSSELAGFLQRSGKLPFGAYVFCYQFIEENSQQSIDENCQEKTIKVFGLPELVSPYDGESLKNLFPMLTWKAPLPLGVGSANVSYELRLVKITEGQSDIQALMTNIPILNVRNLNATFLPYPLSGIPLRKEETYAWQVTAYLGNSEIGKTDIWTFDFKQKNTALAKEEKNSISYSYASTKRKGAYYLMKNDIHLAYDNRTYETELNYRIYENSFLSSHITDLPQVDLEPGLNKIQIKGNDISGLESGKYYTLEIKDTQKMSYYLLFKYLAEIVQNHP